MQISPLNEAQQEAVERRGCSILVSAPAGSGKTKILVSRILSLLEEGYHVDELLVLTFTNAAALEMKQRLEQDLDARLKDNIDLRIQEHLLLQKQKLPTAYITNFHGFCSTLLKQYGYLLAIPSNFDIISDPLLIQHQILDECIDTWLQEDAFKKFITTNFNTYHFNDFKSLLLKLYTLSHNIDDFESYKVSLKERIYSPIINQDSIDSWCLASAIKEELKIKVIEGKNKLIELRNYCQTNGLTFFYNNPYEKGKNVELPSPYDCYIKYFYNILQDLENESLQVIIEKGKPTLDKSYRASFDEETKPFQKQYNALKTSITKGYITKFEDILYTDIKEFSEIMNVSYKTLDTLFTLVSIFEKQYQKYKLEHSLLDFNDLEGFAHTLLDPKYHVVDALYHQLKEIMIDEYQDTNQIQETLIMKIAKYKQPDIPCFMVGDMKQSIYKFRGGDPEIFNEKYLTYDTSSLSAKTKRIDLKFNYRSNKIVLDSVNYICNQIMDSDIGGLDYYYDESAKLNYDYLRKERALSKEDVDIVKKRLDDEQRFTTEVLLMEQNKGTDITTAEKEAMVVGKRIQELVGKLILDDYKVKTRPTEYKDIVVLMRNTSEFITFKKVFDRYNIPNQIVLSQGFLQAQEIINSIYVLRAIDNHLDDIAMVSMLKGNYVMSHFNEQLLLDIRIDKTISVYDNILQYIESKGEYSQQLETFIAYYHDLVIYSKSHSVKELMVKFYEDSQYPLFISSLINGKQRYANIELLLEHLAQESDPLHVVVSKYIQRMENGINMSPGQVLSTNSNTVSFMTIHKSKGLEFPIVFVSQLHKQFNKQDSRERMIMDKQLGIAIKPRIKQNIGDYKDVSVEYDNKYRKLIASAQTKELIDEELRIFYVALTRASQKLILSGAVKSFDQVQSWQQAIINNEDEDMVRNNSKDTVLLYRNIRNASNYLDWLGLSIIRHPQFIRQCKEREFKNKIEDALLQDLKHNADTIAIYENPNNHFSNTEHAKFKLSLITDSDIAEYSYQKEINSIPNTDTYIKYANFKYPKKNILEKSIAVTKKIKDGDREFIDVSYDTEENRIVKANDRGTIIHSVLENIPLQENIDIDIALSSIYQLDIYSKEQITVIENYKHHLQQFIYSDVYQWLLKSQHVYREKNFTLKEENGQIIHGIFDAIIINNNDITIIDYKTDRVAKNTNEETLIKLHQPQMEYYTKIMKKVFPNSNIRAVVYYLYINQYVIL
ncbi:MAG: UvrD-helicase domain-containing protein [Coprobacillaceae bacterium]